MWVREPVGHPGRVAAAAHEPMHTDGRQRQRRLVPMTADADEQRILVE